MGTPLKVARRVGRGGVVTQGRAEGMKMVVVRRHCWGIDEEPKWMEYEMRKSRQRHVVLRAADKLNLHDIYHTG